MKLVHVLGAFALTLMFACNNQPVADQPVEQPAVVEKETVKVVEVEKPAKEVVRVTAPAPVEKEKETSVQIGENGGTLKTRKVDIKIGN